MIHRKELKRLKIDIKLNKKPAPHFIGAVHSKALVRTPKGIWLDSSKFMVTAPSAIFSCIKWYLETIRFILS